MPAKQNSTELHSLGFVLTPGFSLFTLSCAIEAFRMTNEFAGAERFRYYTIGIDDRLTLSSDGLRIAADRTLDDCPPLDLIVLISSLPAAEFFDSKLAAWMRSRCRAGSILAPIGSAAVFAARAGLLNGYHCVTHWKLHDAFAARFPQVTLLKGLYSLDRDRLTCAGGLATFDFGLAVVARLQGEATAAAIADIAMHARIRAPAEQPRMAIEWRYHVNDPRLIKALAAMERNLEQPLSLAQLAREARSSSRQLQRAFTCQLGANPAQIYTRIRLERARELLIRSTLSVTEIALCCGFADAPHLSRRYRDHFGKTPARARRAAIGLTENDAFFPGTWISALS